MERLRRVGEALRGPAPRAPAGATAAALPALDLLEQHDDGSVLPQELEKLRKLEQDAVGKRDYRLAALLRDTTEALRPKPPLRIEDCAPAGVEAQEEFFQRNGFCVVHDVLTAAQLPRAQAAWAAAQEVAEAEWEAEKVGGEGMGGEGGLRFTNRDVYRTFFSIDSLLAVDDVRQRTSFGSLDHYALLRSCAPTFCIQTYRCCWQVFIDIIDSPALVPLMSRVNGSEQALDPDRPISAAGYHGCMRVGGMSGRVVPSGAPAREALPQ
jgi:hypothetical protein